jgi:hypothetical protein
MMQKWKPGDRLFVVTVKRGLPVWTKEEQDAAESWVGEIVGPSLVGPGWWNVRRIGAKGRRGAPFAVPRDEIKPRKR